MLLFSVSTFVLFHFALDRRSVEGDLAAGVLWVTLLFAAVLGDQPAVRGRARAGRLRRLPARAGRPHVAVRRQGGGAVLLPRRRRAGGRAGVRDPAARPVAVGRRCPSWSPCCCWPTSASRWSARWSARSAVQTRARELIVPILALPLMIPLVIAAARATSPLLLEAGRGGAPWPLAGWCSASMISCSACSPSRSSTSCWRSEPATCSPGGSKPLSIASVVLIDRRVRAGVLLRAQRRRPGLHPEDLLPARAAGDRRAVRVRGRRRVRASGTCATGDRAHDLRSYVAIHISLILGVGALITGSIWAKASWGHWWVWEEPTLVSFLIVFLLYACYQPLRFSIEDPERQARTPPSSRSWRARSCR